MKQQVQNEINRLVSILENSQLSDGSWEYPFDTGIITDCYMIILLRSLEIHEEELIVGLVKRIISKQYSDGSWRLFRDEAPGNLSLTIDAYYSILYSGYIKGNEKILENAKRFILENGGLEKAGLLTKVLLLITGQMEWPSYLKIPIELILIPKSFPLNFYSLSVFGRSNLAPLLLLADRKIAFKTNKSPDLSNLFVEHDREGLFFAREAENWSSVLEEIKGAIEQLAGIPEELHEKAQRKLKRYILKRVEPDGTLHSYFSATFFMVFALLASGSKQTDPTIVEAVKGLKSMVCLIDGVPHCQYTTANVWNTSLISYAMQEAGVDPSHTAIRMANSYLLSRQHVRYGDWSVHNTSAKPGGWGFSNINTTNPDVDDSTASLRAIRTYAASDPTYRHSWERGIDWVISMQNDDGGWSAFERNADNPLFAMIPGGDTFLIDPSSVDLTARTLEFFGTYTHADMERRPFKKAVQWLLHRQESNGSWNSRWGINYIYGTWAALTGLSSAGYQNLPAVQKAVQWLLSIQNQDGGWGESCNSDIQSEYIPLHASTLTHTAWALDGLIAVSGRVTPQISKGVNFLLKNADINNWKEDYPKGQGAAGLFYIHYHSYRYIWPLLALSHFNRKWLK
jgi:sporulenol synthase